MTKARDLANGGFGLVLIKPSTVVNGTDNGKGTVSFSAASSVSLNGIFNSTYTNYQVVLNCASATSQVELLFRYRASGSDASGANYYSQLLTVNGTSVAGERVSDATSGTMAQLQAQENGIIAYFFKPFEAVRTMMTSVSNNHVDNIRFRNVGAMHSLSTSYDGLTLTCSQNITGTISVYGINK